MDAVGFDVWSAIVAGADLPELTERPAWHKSAACRDEAVDLFFAHDKDIAKAVCARCPVVEECLAEALATPPSTACGAAFQWSSGESSAGAPGGRRDWISDRASGRSQGNGSLRLRARNLDWIRKALTVDFHGSEVAP